MDLSPREPDEPRKPRRWTRRWVPIGILVLVVAAGGVLVTQFLTSAVDYYCNVDEVGEKSGCGAGRSLRVQGTVEPGSIARESGTTTFDISFNDESLPVRYAGEPGGVFDECMAVVVHGELDDSANTFIGSRIEAKHSNEYESENSERLDEAVGESGADTCT